MAPLPSGHISKRWQIGGSILIVLIFAACSFSQTFKVHGDYGLWIETTDDSIHVHWLTMMPDTGMAKIMADDRVLDSTITAFDFAHRAAFSTHNQPKLDLYYGSYFNTEDQHQKTVYLDSNPPQSFEFPSADTIYVVGDVHGKYDNLVTLLTNSQIIDSTLQWRAGKSHLVFTGDIFDRGNDVTKTLWFMYELERQARSAGGHVHFILGNHEIMIFTHDVRYTAGKEKVLADYHGTTYTQMFDLKSSVLGRWLAQKPILLKIEPFIFTHGGVALRYVGQSIESLNQTLGKLLQEPVFPFLLTDSTWASFIDSAQYITRMDFFFGPNSLFWYRGYATNDTLNAELGKVLDFYDAQAMVIGHTALDQIKAIYDAKLYAIDLKNPASEMLALINKGSFHAYRFKLDGTKTLLHPLPPP